MSEQIFGMAAGCKFLGRIPESIPQHLHETLATSRTDRAVQDLNTATERLPQRGKSYLCSTPEKEALPHGEIAEVVNQFGAECLGAFAATLDRRMAAQMRSGLLHSVEAWSEGFKTPASKIEGSIIRDAYISLSKEQDVVASVGWYLVMFALRDRSDDVLAPLLDLAPENIKVKSFIDSARSSSRASAAVLFYQRLEGTLHG